MKSCLVCGAALPAFSHQSICKDEACRQLKIQYELRPPKTEIERRLYAFQLEKMRCNIANRKAVQAENKRILQQELTRREQENLEYRRQLLAKNSTIAGYLWFTLPSGRKKVTNLPMSRRRIFRDFLNKLIGQLYANRKKESKPGARNTASRHIVDLQQQFCAVCQGGCCTNGSNNAYLSVETLLNFMRLNPHHRPRHILAAYLDRLPEKSFSNSCIYHTGKGCNLPREMRSEVCNQFLCSPVSEFCMQHNGEGEIEGVLLLLRRQDLWRQTHIELNNDLLGAYVIEHQQIRSLTD